MSKHHNIIAILLSVSAFILACNTAPPPQAGAGSADTKQAGRGPLPDEREVASALDVPIERLDGTTFKLADFRGKVLIVDFWATYCSICVKQMPQLAELGR